MLGEINFDSRRNAATEPVLNTLDAPGFGEVQQFSDFCGAAQSGDKFMISHRAPLNTTFSILSNSTFNNELFSGTKIGAMNERHITLERLLAEADMGPSALANALGESEQTITNWGKRGVSKGGAVKAQGLLGISATYVMTGAGAARLAAAPASARVGKFIGVPVVGTAQLGDNGHHCELEYPVGHGDGAVRWLTNDRNAYALRCKGESMKPRVRHGEFVVIEPAHACKSGDEVLVKLKDGRVMVKQLAYSRDGLVHFDSVNESFPRISVAEAEIDVIQYVAGIAKSGLWNEQ